MPPVSVLGSQVNPQLELAHNFCWLPLLLAAPTAEVQLDQVATAFVACFNALYAMQARIQIRNAETEVSTLNPLDWKDSD
jgi:hypothetical protein